MQRGEHTMKKYGIITALYILATMACMSVAEAGNKNQALNKEAPKGGWLGVMISDVTDGIVEEKSLSVREGAYVSDVVDGSPADSAGIREGDVIIGLDGKKIADADGLQQTVKEIDAGKTISVVLMRGAERKTVKVTLGAAKKETITIRKKIRIPEPGPTPRAPKAPTTGMLSWIGESGGIYGLALSTLNEQLAGYFGAPENKGVLVEHVKKDSKGDKAGFKAGDVIVRAGKKTIVETKDFRNVFGAYDAGEKIPVEILRKGEKKTLSLEAEDEKEDDHSMLYKFFNNGPHSFLFKSGQGDVGMDIDVDLDEMNIDLNDMKIDLKDALKDIDEEVKVNLQRAYKDAKKSDEHARKSRKRISEFSRDV